MKLRIKFTFLTFGLIATLVILSSGLYFVSNRIIKLKDYNIRLSEAKYDVADISDYINKVLFHEAELNTISKEWSLRLQRITDDFEALNTKKIKGFVPEETVENLAQLESFWMILSARFTSFDSHLKAISQMSFDSNAYNQIKSQGIMNAWLKNEELSNISSLSFELLILQSEIRQLSFAKSELDKGYANYASGKAQLENGAADLAEGLKQLNVYEGGQQQVAEGLDLVIATDTYYNKKGDSCREHCGPAGSGLLLLEDRCGRLSPCP